MIEIPQLPVPITKSLIVNPSYSPRVFVVNFNPKSPIRSPHGKIPWYHVHTGDTPITG